MKKLTKSLSLSSENNIHYHIPQRWSSLFQNYHSHFIVQKKKLLINVTNFLANHSPHFPSFKINHVCFTQRATASPNWQLSIQKSRHQSRIMETLASVYKHPRASHFTLAESGSFFSPTNQATLASPFVSPRKW